MWFWTMESNVDHKKNIFTKKEISHLPATLPPTSPIFDVPASHTSLPPIDVPTSLPSRP